MTSELSLLQPLFKLSQCGDGHMKQQGKGEMLQQIHQPICHGMCLFVGPGSNIANNFTE